MGEWEKSEDKNGKWEEKGGGEKRKGGEQNDLSNFNGICKWRRGARGGERCIGSKRIGGL